MKQESLQPTPGGRSGRMRIGRRVAKVVFWGLVLCLSILGGGLWFAYWYMTDSESAAQLIREHAIRYFPHSILDPGRVRTRLFAGEVVLRQLQLRQQIDGVGFEAVRIPWLHIRINPRKLLQGHLEVRNVEVVEPTLRLRRRRDGTWNLQGLFADPWPAPWIETPPISIRRATLELTPEEEPASTPVTAPAGPARRPLSPARRSSPSLARAASQDAPSPSSPSPLPSPAPAKTGNGGGRSPAILRDVELNDRGGRRRRGPAQVRGLGPRRHVRPADPQGDGRPDHGKRHAGRRAIRADALRNLAPANPARVTPGGSGAGPQ